MRRNSSRADSTALFVTSTTATARSRISVEDATANESDGHIDFTISLTRAAIAPITVDYATADDSAGAPGDYTAASGTVTFRAREQSKTVRVTIADDGVNEGSETFFLRLSDATGAFIADAEAIGTIGNWDPLQQAWIARFGRTVAGQVLDAVGDRLAGGGTSHVTIGRQRLDADGDLVEDEDQPKRLGDFAEANEELRSLDMTPRDLVLGSSFQFGGGGEPGGGSWAAWGKFALGSFEAEVDGLKLEGDVTTGDAWRQISRATVGSRGWL